MSFIIWESRNFAEEKGGSLCPKISLEGGLRASLSRCTTRVC